MRHRVYPAFCLVGLALLAGGAAAAGGEPAAPVATTAHFAFHSDLDTNLDDTLIAAGSARAEQKPEPGPSPACLDALPPAERAAWHRAVDYYAEVVSPAGVFDRERMLVRYALAGLDQDLAEPADERFIQVGRGMLAAASPAFRACAWPQRDAANRRWIDELLPRLADHEAAIAARLQSLYGVEWHGLPIRVDVVETVSRAGASTVFAPRRQPGGHVLISTDYAGLLALEGVFHEASHLLMGFGAPVRDALMQAARERELSLEGRRWHDLWHSVLFFTTGEVVRARLAAEDGADYVPMMEAEGIYASYHEPLTAAWRPYVDGRRGLAEAASQLVRLLGERD